MAPRKKEIKPVVITRSRVVSVPVSVPAPPPPPPAPENTHVKPANLLQLIHAHVQTRLCVQQIDLVAVRSGEDVVE